MKRNPILWTLLAAAALALGISLDESAHAQTVGTYTEDNGNVKNNIGVYVEGGLTGTSSQSIQGSIAHDSPVSTTFPVTIGCSAITTTVQAAVSASSDATRVACTTNGEIITTPTATSNAALGATIHASSSTQVTAGSAVAKSGAGNLYSVNVIGGASAGFLMLFNATTIPVDGTVAPVMCFPVGAGQMMSPNLATAVPAAFTTGIVWVYSTTGCHTKTVAAVGFVSITYE